MVQLDKRLRRIIDNTPNLVWVTDRKGVVEYAGPALGLALGLSPERLVNRTSASLIHPADRARFEADWARWLNGEFSGEYRLWSGPDEAPPVVALRGAAANLSAAKGIVVVGRELTFNKQTGEAPRPKPAAIPSPEGPTGPDPRPLRNLVEAGTRRQSEGYRLEPDYQQAFFEHLFEYSPEAMVITDPEGQIDLVNTAFERLTGYDRADLKGRNMSELVEDQDRPDLFRRSRSESVRTGEARLRHWEGRPIDAALSAAPIAVNHIQIGLLITFRDVTSLKQSEALLQRDKRRFQSLVETSPLGVALMGPDGNNQYLNPAFTRMLGYRLEEVVSGRDFFARAFPDPAYRARVMKAWLETLERFEPGGVRPLKCNVVLADGSTRIVEFRPMTLADGGTVVTVEDVTDQELTVRALKRSEQRLRSIFDNAASGLAVINFDFCFERVNQRLAEMLDIPAEDLVGKSVLDLAHPEDRVACQSGLESVTKSPGATDRQEIRYLQGDGSAIWVDQAIRGLTSEGGELEGLVFIASDITPRKELEQKLHHLATTDPLTGINNRRQQLRLTDKEIIRARRYGQALSLLVIDVDDFKAVNDRYGHASGDHVLREVADIGVNELRDSDFLGRIGGEEFAATLVHSDLNQALITAERLRRAFEEYRFSLDGQPVQVTVSIGAAQFKPDGDDLVSLFDRADKAMYLAKSRGKNQVAGQETAD